MVTQFLTKAQLAAEHLHHAIRRGDLAPGERIDMEQLSAQLGMSATPIREALRALEKEGLVTIEPHREARVKAFSADDVDGLFELRAVLEPYAMRLSVDHLQPE